MSSLFCILKGESFVDVFSVEVGDTDYVSDLKLLIRKELQPPINQVDPTFLMVYSFSIPQRDYHALEKCYRLIDQGEILSVNPWDLVKYVFDLRPAMSIKVVVNVSGKWRDL
jgi:hypothetical protein